jgi:hypothetical protein
VLRPSTSNSSGEYLNEVNGTPEDSHSFSLPRPPSMVNHSTENINTEVKPTRLRRDSYHSNDQRGEQENVLSYSNEPQNGHKPSRRHCHGHLCNPCIGNFNLSRRDKRSSSMNNDDKDRESVEAYDLAAKGQHQVRVFFKAPNILFWDSIFENRIFGRMEEFLKYKNSFS